MILWSSSATMDEHDVNSLSKVVYGNSIVHLSVQMLFVMCSV